jgi:hypothetical protein
VEKLAPCEHHRIEQLLDLRVTRLGLGQHLVDVVYGRWTGRVRPFSVRSTTMTALTTWVVAAT